MLVRHNKAMIGLLSLLAPVLLMSGAVWAAIPADQLSVQVVPGSPVNWESPAYESGTIVQLLAHIPRHNLAELDRLTLVASAPGQRDVSKTLHAGDPSLYVPIRLTQGGSLKVSAVCESGTSLPLQASLYPLAKSATETASFEAEPNNSWKEAQPLTLGQVVYGNNDDTDYLDNKYEEPVKGYANGLDNPVRDRPGLDWFRLDVAEEQPRLVIFELDVLDRDVSVNLRMYRPNAEGTGVDLFMDGTDPMEIIHDREPERYSKSISRILKPGTYYLQVNGNHPRYVLRSTAYRVPPYDNPKEAVTAGAHYVMNVGDAWVAQVPREGNIYKRVQNMHDSTTKCTACHPSIFSTEAVLTAKKYGYPITAKNNLQNVVERLYNGPVEMYGPYDVFWQRYIAIPMQSQGKHGMMLMDFEKHVSLRETPFFERFAPFLRHAWTGIDELHPDEANGVVPADSNVGFAVRDWIVLTEAYRRTGDRGYLDIANHVRSIVTGPKCDQKNIQDKIHRVWGLSVMGRENPEEFSEPLQAAIAEIMGYQNDDGGWPDEVEKGRDSAVYTTGQVVWTLIQAGETLESQPTFAKAAEYLLSQQQEFGGWFQTTTHENFRTPMRETRYAVMALSALYPSEDASPAGWENRDRTDGKIPTNASVLATLQALDNLWEVPKGREEEYTQDILPLLDHETPLVRSTAAETLGRVGTESAIPTLVGLLNDPVKDVWRSAAWALRQFGNRGQGLEAIVAALRSDDSATRRGAARVFAYQYYGIDHRLDIAEDLMQLTKDDNLWTRLESLKSLRQWFYRSNENAFKRQVVDLYIDHMGREEHAAIRTNLAQGMYIMLDENQAGGVSLERNIARFPHERDRETVIDARRHVEQSVLLEPVLESLTSGNRLQKEALLASFDGTFFAGRFYIRNPTAMIDVGNDREFSFYFKPPRQVLERALRSLLESELSAKSEAQAVELANFFRLPRDSEDTVIQSAILARLNSPESVIREAALKVVRDDLALNGAENSPELMSQFVQLLESGGVEAQVALLSAAKRNPAVLHEPRITAIVNNAVGNVLSNPDLRPVVIAVADTDLLPDKDALRVIENTFNEEENESLRLALVDRLFDRAPLVDNRVVTRDLLRVLDTIAGDPVTAVRERLIGRLENSANLRYSPHVVELLHAGLSDTSPGIRRRSLQLAQDHVEIWENPATYEYLLRLVIDPDPKIRKLTLDSLDRFNLLGREPRFASRIKSLSKDPELGPRATEILAAAGLDPNAIEADGVIQTFGIPDLEFFREKVNPHFYVAGADKQSCAECHQTHSILRIAGMPTGATQLPEDLLIQNMNSALKVVNLGDPEQSLLLRKPRSPQGQGEANAASPTGLTHVGGARWETTAHPAYQVIVDWIRDANSVIQRRVGISASVDSYSPEYPAEFALDNNPHTIWHTEFVGAAPPYPHEIVVDLGEPTDTSAFQYVPRQDGTNGRVKKWELYTSTDGKEWGGTVASGDWPNDAAVQTVPLRRAGIRYVKLKGLSSVDGQPLMSAAEVIVLRAKHEVASTTTP